MCGREFAWRHVLAAVCLGHDTVVTRQRQGGNKTRTIQYTESTGLDDYWTRLEVNARQFTGHIRVGTKNGTARLGTRLPQLHVMGKVIFPHYSWGTHHSIISNAHSPTIQGSPPPPVPCTLIIACPIVHCKIYTPSTPDISYTTTPGSDNINLITLPCGSHSMPES
jgi:hypothetical protein